MSDQFLPFIRQAYELAANSGDLSTRVGAVLLTNAGEPLAGGWNDIEPAVCDRPDRRQPPAKYLWVTHAELSAIGRAVRDGAGGRVRGGTMVATWAACADCAKAIAGVGIVRLVRHVRPDGTPWMAHGDWVKSAAVGDEIMRAAGVEIVEVKTVLGQTALLGGLVVGV